MKTYLAVSRELERPVIFMAYSLGGIVVKWVSVGYQIHDEMICAKLATCKQALRISRTQAKYSDIDTFTRGIVFFGTPHHGSVTANWGKTVAGVANVFKSTNTTI